MRALVLGVCLAVAACGQRAEAPADAAPAAAASSTLFTYGGGFAPLFSTAENPYYENTPPPTWFICDSITSPDAFVASIPDEGGAFMLARYHKDTQAIERMNVRTTGEMFSGEYGPAQGFLDEAGTQGAIYTLDAARMSSPDAATTTPVMMVEFAGEGFHCRWFEYMAFIGFTNTQSVVVRRRGDAIDMMTFRHDAEGALMVEMEHEEASTTVDITAENGQQSDGYNRENVIQFGFVSGSDGAGYSVWTVPDEASVIQRLQGGEVVSTEEFRAYALAR